MSMSAVCICRAGSGEYTSRSCIRIITRNQSIVAIGAVRSVTGAERSSSNPLQSKVHKAPGSLGDEAQSQSLTRDLRDAVRKGLETSLVNRLLPPCLAIAPTAIRLVNWTGVLYLREQLS